MLIIYLTLRVAGWTRTPLCWRLTGGGHVVAISFSRMAWSLLVFYRLVFGVLSSGSLIRAVWDFYVIIELLMELCVHFDDVSWDVILKRTKSHQIKQLRDQNFQNKCLEGLNFFVEIFIGKINLFDHNFFLVLPDFKRCTNLTATRKINDTSMILFFDIVYA